MTIPSVNVTERDNALGVLPPISGLPMAIVGVSSTGTAATPVLYARTTDVKADFGVGPLVEAACHAIERYGRPVLICKATSSTAGSYGTVGTSGVTGTSVVTADAVMLPYDDYDVKVVIVTGGTRGTAGITYKYSLDGGVSYSATQSLGTDTALTIAEGNVKFPLATGTLVAGDYWTCRTVAPAWNATDLGTALDALKVSTVSWSLCEIVGNIDATALSAIETKFAAMFTAGKPRAYIGHCRMPSASETEATYLTAMQTIFSSLSASYGALCYGACKMTSSVVSGRRYRRPISYVVAARQSSLSDEQNVADINLGALTGITIRDSYGNVDQHDEAVNPGGDDLRMITLRTYDEVQGVYVTRPRMFTAEGSDFQLLPHRLVMNIAERVLRAFFVRRLNAPIQVSRTTGYILESTAKEIEAGANAALRSALGSKPMASGWSVTISRTDNILSTRTMTVTARIIPLAYPETINLEIGFSNPVNQVLAA